jgi:hypothetical protein
MRPLAWGKSSPYFPKDIAKQQTLANHDFSEMQENYLNIFVTYCHLSNLISV